MLLLVGLALLAAAQAASQREQHMAFLKQAEQSPQGHFKAWVAEHAKAYAEDAGEMARRFAVWQDNLKFVLQHNARNDKTYWLGMSHLAGMYVATPRPCEGVGV